MWIESGRSRRLRTASVLLDMLLDQTLRCSAEPGFDQYLVECLQVDPIELDQDCRKSIEMWCREEGVRIACRQVVLHANVWDVCGEHRSLRGALAQCLDAGSGSGVLPGEAFVLDSPAEMSACEVFADLG